MPVKGPYERLKYDLRRLWECPVCQHKLRLPGERTSALCQCQQAAPLEEQVWMRLVDDCERPLRRVAPAGAFPLSVSADHFLAVAGELPVDQEQSAESVEDISEPPGNQPEGENPST